MYLRQPTTPAPTAGVHSGVPAPWESDVESAHTLAHGHSRYPDHAEHHRGSGKSYSVTPTSAITPAQYDRYHHTSAYPAPWERDIEGAHTLAHGQSRYPTHQAHHRYGRPLSTELGKAMYHQQTVTPLFVEKNTGHHATSAKHVAHHGYRGHMTPREAKKLPKSYHDYEATMPPACTEDYSYWRSRTPESHHHQTTSETPSGLPLVTEHVVGYGCDNIDHSYWRRRSTTTVPPTHTTCPTSSARAHSISAHIHERVHANLSLKQHKVLTKEEQKIADLERKRAKASSVSRREKITHKEATVHARTAKKIAKLQRKAERKEMKKQAKVLK